LNIANCKLTSAEPVSRFQSAILNSQFAILLVLLGLAASGCGPGRERGTLTGTVSFQGQPVTDGIVLFSGDVSYMYSIQPDGTFEAKTAEGKGVWAGTYRVAVAPALADPEMGVGKSPPRISIPSNIPRRYWKPETSGIEVEIKEGQNEPLAIELKE
jgi:hypothetical protein